MTKVVVLLISMFSLVLLGACGQSGPVTTTTTQNPPLSSSPSPTATNVISPEDVLAGLPVYPGAKPTTTDDPFYGSPVVSFLQQAYTDSPIPETQSASAQYIVQALAIDIMSWYPNELVAKGYRQYLLSQGSGNNSGITFFLPSQPLFDIEVHIHAVPNAVPSTTVFELLVTYHVPLPKPPEEILPDDIDSITATYFSGAQPFIKTLTDKQVIEQLVTMVNNLPIRTCKHCIHSCPPGGPWTMFSLVFHSQARGGITVTDIAACEETGIHIGNYPILEDRYALLWETVKQIVGVQDNYPGLSSSYMPTVTPVPTSTNVQPLSEMNKYLYYDLAQKADTVVIGKVRASCPECQVNEGKYIVECWNVEVKSYIKNPQPFDLIQVQVMHISDALYDKPGGIVIANYSTPDLVEGEDVLLLLQKSDGVPPSQFMLMIGGPHYETGNEIDNLSGKFLIENDKAQNVTIHQGLPEWPWEPLDQIIAAITSPVPISPPPTTTPIT